MSTMKNVQEGYLGEVLDRSVNKTALAESVLKQSKGDVASTRKDDGASQEDLKADDP